jgi:DNA recombination protein RmuC
MPEQILVALAILGIPCMLAAAVLLLDRLRLTERLSECRAQRDAFEQRAIEAESATMTDEEARLEAARLRERLEASERRYADHVEASERERREQAERDEKRLREVNEAYQEKLEALASKALASSNEQFLKLATETFARHREAASVDMDKRRKALDELIAPIGEALKRTDEKLGKIEHNRLESQASLQKHLEMLSSQTRQVEATASRLAQSLHSPQVRGRWGEMTLRNVVELAGMSEHCDFATQQTVGEDGSTLRPDMTIRLPGDRMIVVDAKAPIQAYLEALESETEEQRSERLRAHAQQVRRRVDDLAGRKYFAQFEQAPDFVVLFVPGDQFLSAAMLQDPSMLEYAAAKRVILTTPATLIALLKAVGFGWAQASLAEDAREILVLGRTMHERLGVMAEHLGEIGRHLSRTVNAYNRSVGSYESRVLPAARRLEDHHAQSGKDLADAERVGVEPRLPAGETTGGGRGPVEEDTPLLDGDENGSANGHAPKPTVRKVKRRASTSSRKSTLGKGLSKRKSDEADG